MTAMIDLVFLLLIFFMCASLGQVGELLVPTRMSAGSIASAEFQKQEKPFGEVWLFLRRDTDGHTVVQLNQGGSLFRKDPQGTFRRTQDGSEGNTLADVLRQLAVAEPSIPVFLDIQNNVPMGDVMAVRVAVLNARFQNVKFAMEAGR